ncbi:hypothetical protein BVG19_g3959 [[Candida] boidinii]|nr:hypothetical protein BVG19_g3959 [[Candida] boidinii]OWB51345.1 hypothetical protein B5S27_g2905 [[Candida] boidinii]
MSINNINSKNSTNIIPVSAECRQADEGKSVSSKYLKAGFSFGSKSHNSINSKISSNSRSNSYSYTTNRSNPHANSRKFSNSDEMDTSIDNSFKRRGSSFTSPSSPWARRKSFLSPSMVSSEKHCVYELQTYDSYTEYSSRGSTSLPMSSSSSSTTTNTTNIPGSTSTSSSYAGIIGSSSAANTTSASKITTTMHGTRYGSAYSSSSTVSSRPIPTFSVCLNESQGFLWNQDLFASQYQQAIALRKYRSSSTPGSQNYRSSLGKDSTPSPSPFYSSTADEMNSRVGIEVIDIILDNDDNDNAIDTDSESEADSEVISRSVRKHGRLSNAQLIEDDQDTQDEENDNEDEEMFKSDT